MADNYPAGITTEFSLKNLARTLNPFSKVFGGNDPQYVPKFLINSAKSFNDSPDWTQNKAAKLAHVFSKIVGGGAAAATVFAALRLGAHSMDMDKINLAGKTAGQDLQKQYVKPTAPLLLPQDTQDKTIEMNKNAVWDPYSAALATIPPAVALISAATAFKKADQFADRRQQKELNKNIASTIQDINQLGMSNIKKVRGAQKPKQSKKQQSQAKTQKPEQKVQKQASEAIPAAASFLALLAAAASMAIGFNVQRAYDPDTIKYKALKKGIKQYNKIKSTERLFNTQPINQKVLKSLDPQPKQGKAAIDQLPEVHTEAMYRPVDI